MTIPPLIVLHGDASAALLRERVWVAAIEAGVRPAPGSWVLTRLGAGIT